MRWLTRALADIQISLLKQPITSFCDINTAGDDCLLTHTGDAATIVRILGVRRTLTEADINRAADGLRLELSGAFDQPGHALQFWFGVDPGLSSTEIRRVLRAPRGTAEHLGLDLTDIFAERERRLPTMMRWEAACVVLWTKRRAALTRLENSLADGQINAARQAMPDMGDAQQPFLATDVVVGRHRAFVDRVLGALRNQQITHEEISPREMLRVSREVLLPETSGTEWTPSLPGDPVMPRLTDEGQPETAEGLLWPSLPEQICTEGATELSASTVRVGAHDWASLDMWLGPERPQPFAHLVHGMALEHIPWRASFLIEGGAGTSYAMKAAAAQLLAFLPSNRATWTGIKANADLRDASQDVLVRFRASFATWAPAGEPGTLQRRKAILEHRVQTWGNLRAKFGAGDPLAGLMSSTLGMAAASTAKPAQAPLGDILRMMPWARPGSPWTDGPVLFRSPDGRIWPYDPSSPTRIKVTDIYTGPSRRGKSVLANTNLLGFILSNAAQGRRGARLPLVGKIDIGRSAEGLVVLLREALPEARRQEALYVKLQAIPEHAANILDTQVGCRRPLPLEKAFQQSFLSLITTPPGGVPQEGMGMLISLVLDEVYRMFGDEGANTSPKPYHAGVDPRVDQALRRIGASLPEEPYWWEVVDALCAAGDHVTAELANRHAVPRISDLISAGRSQHVQQLFERVIPHQVETLVEMFERYVKAFVQRFSTLDAPTRIDFGQARVIVLDLDAVAPTGSPDADWQTSVMYLLARHMIGRNFFLRPEYAEHVPPLVRDYHLERFTEAYEAVKRLEYDEYQRTISQPDVRAQVERDDREGAKHAVQLGISSQRSDDFGEHLLSQATGRWICGVGDADEADRLADRLRLAAGTRETIRSRLNGPDHRHGGAPFVLVMNAADTVWEQMLVNSLGPVELWALSTTPEDAALRDSLYDRLGFGEALRRLARVFAGGTAVREIKRRKDRRVLRGEESERAEQGVVMELSDEIANGVGLGMILRDAESLAIAAE